ncbi:MAG: M64 family metallopeptidase [archaeon]
MALKLSISAMVIIFLSVFALVLGVIYLTNLYIFSQDITSTELPIPNIDPDTRPATTRIDLVVTPSSSLKGTVFALIADTWPPTPNQALNLIIEKEGEETSVVLFDDGQHYDGQSNDGTYGALLDSQDLSLGVYQVKDEEYNELAEFTLHDSKCQPLIGSPTNDKINFLILPYGYSDLEAFKQDAQDVILGKNSIYGIEPFKSNFDRFSFSFVEPTEDLECEVGCKGIETMVCCNDARVVDTASQCHYDGIIVLINSDEGCGTASFYTKLCGKSSKAGLILAHELGHSFGGLADEYVYQDYFDSYNIPDSLILSMPNCDTEGCEKWAGITDQCFEGCTSPNLYRPSPNSIMRYLSFGKFNEVSQTSLQEEVNRHVIQEAQLDYKDPNLKSYYVNLHYEDGNIQLGPVTALPVKPGIISTTGYFTANLRGKNGALLHTTKIPLPIFELPALEISDKPIVLQKITLPVILPFTPNAQSIEIVADARIVATASLSPFQENCGNGICDPEENRVTCNEDCTLQNDNLCEFSHCDPDCPDQEACNQTTKEKYIWTITLIVIALIAILVVLFRSKKN